MKYDDSSTLSKVHLCEHFSAWVHITQPDQTLEAKCDICGKVEWKNNAENNDNDHECPGYSRSG